MARNRNEQPVGIARINCHLRDLLAVAQAQVHPRRAAVGGLVDAVADREIRTMQPFAAADVNNVRIRRRNFDCTDRASRLLIKDRLPGPPKVIGLPDPAIHGAYIEHVRLTRHARNRTRAPAAKRANIAPLHLVEEFGVDLLRADRRNETKTEKYEEGRSRCGTYLHQRLNLNAIFAES